MIPTPQLPLAVSFLLLASACGDDGDGAATGATFVPRLVALHAEPDPVNGGRIVDAEGRHVLLRGVNVNAFAVGPVCHFLPCLLAVVAVSASSVSASGPIPTEAPSVLRAPFEHSWETAEQAERVGDELENPEEAITHFRHAGELFDSIAQQRSLPARAADAYWRSARCFWLAADRMPRESKDERVSLYLRAEVQAEKGIEVNPKCGECMLWKFSSMGRLATTRGIWGASRQVSVMADLLDRGIELQPTHADHEHNSVLGNLHYSSAIFYRVLPDSFFMRWLLGVRGDKERALQHIQTALVLHPARLDYQVELGSQHLCIGTTKNDAEHLRQGREVLLNAVQRETNGLDDEREIDAARIMLDQPDKSCGYSGDAWLEIDSKSAERAAKH